MLPKFALSIRQPWAWAIIFAGKDIENRSWQSVRNMRNGHLNNTPIAIHAAKGMTQSEYESASAFMAGIGIEAPQPDDLHYGAVIGTARIVEVVSESESPWFFGPRGLVLEKVKPLTPVGVTGALGLFQWEERQTFEVTEPKLWMRNYGKQKDDLLL